MIPGYTSYPISPEIFHLNLSYDIAVVLKHRSTSSAEKKSLNLRHGFAPLFTISRTPSVFPAFT